MKLYEILENQLKNENNFVTDNGELKKWVVINKAQNFDARLLELLLDNEELKERFFVNVKGTLVFNQNLFIQFLEQKNYLNDSYTQYKNKVGLTIDGKYLKQRNEVALVWPFKDCVLEGGQSREEDKREEIFFNEILAQDEITQLLEPKVLTNAKTFDKDGEHAFKGFTRDAELNKKRGLPEDTITDNLIIKGNNLLALHSLKKEFAGKVKLIYIDPPYNTGSDSFKYNDNFNHSTWLTFMRNRLFTAKILLRKDGFIFINIDDNQQAYLSVLMDEVFGNENKFDKVSVKTSSSQGGFGDVNPGYISNTENIIIYSKSKSSSAFIDENLYVEKEYDENYTQIVINIDEPTKKWKFENLNNLVYREVGIDEPYNNQTWRKLKEIWGDNWKEKRYARKAQLALSNKDSVFRTFNPNKPAKYLKDALELSKKNKNIVVEANSGSNDIKLCLNGEVIAFYSNIFKTIDGTSIPATRLSTFWADIPWEGISNEGGVKLNNGKKPEKLMRRIIESVTLENDIVLDYHLGSGTTTAVAHKLNRQYIGVEQIQNQINLSITRLNNVINKDSSGISKYVNWQGGGSFTYLELKKYNQTFIDQIEEAKDTKALLAIWEEMKAKSFLNYNVDIKKQDEHIEEFKQLDLAQQKEHLLELLDKNQLYVNLSSLNDEDFACTDAEKQVTKDFYQIKKD